MEMAPFNRYPLEIPVYLQEYTANFNMKLPLRRVLNDFISSIKWEGSKQKKTKMKGSSLIIIVISLEFIWRHNENSCAYFLLLKNSHLHILICY